MTSQIGSRIHLTSVSEIRYEGLLHNIDIEGNTVSLTQVRIFGTEGRKGGVDEVPPSSEVFEIIVFRGSDIKDLTLFDEDTKSMQDPAIVSATRATDHSGHQSSSNTNNHHHNNNNNNHQGYRNNNNNNNMGNWNGGRGGNRGFYDNERRGGGGRGGGMRRGGDFERRHHDGGRGGNNNNNNNHYHRRHQDAHTGKEFRVGGHNGGKDPKEEFKEEFDFSRGREEFEKTKKEFEDSKEEKGRAYNKASFFDTISCDQKENRMGREEMKKADTETFGPDMVGNMRKFRRGRYRR